MYVLSEFILSGCFQVLSKFTLGPKGGYRGEKLFGLFG